MTMSYLPCGWNFLPLACLISLVPASLSAQQPKTAPLPEPGRVRPSETGVIAIMKHEIQPFGKTNDGQEVKVHILTNLKGVTAKIIDYGATLLSLETPDRTGKNANITLGFPTLEGYLQRHPYFGSTVGRYANRIAKGQFTLDGQIYKLATNNGPNHLH